MFTWIWLVWRPVYKAPTISYLLNTVENTKHGTNWAYTVSFYSFCLDCLTVTWKGIENLNKPLLCPNPKRIKEGQKPSLAFSRPLFLDVPKVFRIKITLNKVVPLTSYAFRIVMIQFLLESITNRSVHVTIFDLKFKPQYKYQLGVICTNIYT